MRVFKARILLIVCLGLVSSGATGPRAFDETRFAFDVVKLTPKNQFADSNLTALFTKFAKEQESKHRLSRLTVSFRESDILYALTGVGALEYSNPLPNRQPGPTHFAAQLFCLNGAASALIKTGAHVTRIQILGNRDPREVSVGTRTVRLISFKIHAASDLLDARRSKTGQDWIKLHALAQPLLTIPEAESLYATLKTSLGTEALSLNVEPDRDFEDYEGPPFDLLHAPVTGLPYSETWVRYISCIPPNWKNEEVFRTTKRTCEIAHALRRSWPLAQGGRETRPQGAQTKGERRKVIALFDRSIAAREGIRTEGE
jgi:hypothetical protein